MICCSTVESPWILKPPRSVVGASMTINAFRIVSHMPFCYPSIYMSRWSKIVICERSRNVYAIVNEITGKGSIRIPTDMVLLTCVQSSITSRRTVSEGVCSATYASKPSILIDVTGISTYKTNKTSL